MRRGIAVVLALSLALINLPAKAATPKVGGSCPKSGQSKSVSGKKFTCVLKNKKLVWVQSAVKPVAAPPPTSSPTTPTTVIPYVQRWRALDSRALEVFDKWRADTAVMPSQHGVSLTYVVNTSVTEDILQELKKRYEFVARYWEQHQKTLLPLRILVAGGGEYVWTCQQKLAWLNYGQSQQDCERIEGGNLLNGFMAGQSQWRERKVDSYNIPNLARLFERENIPRVEHEYTHSIFYEQSWKYQEQVPCWLTEGGAEFFGTLISTSDSASRYLDLRNSRITGRGGPGSGQIDWVNFINRTDRSDLSGRGGDPCLEVRSEIYHHAVLPVEFLVDRLGIPGLLALMRETAKTPWAVEIERAFSKPKSEVYNDIAVYAKKEFDLVQANRWSTGYCLFNAKAPVCAP